MFSSIIRAVFVGLPALALGLASVPCLAKAPQAKGRTITVNCDNKSLQGAVDRAHQGDTINVSGTCDERITVRTDKITIDGGGSAVIDGTVRLRRRSSAGHH